MAEMRLITGGYAQGKLDCVLSQMSPEQKDRCLCIGENSYDPITKIVNPEKWDTLIVNHLHLIIKKLGAKETADTWIWPLIDECERKGLNLIIICDELGCGIVPTEKEDRVYRENVGRIMCELAAKADKVERVVCGIMMRLK